MKMIFGGFVVLNTVIAIDCVIHAHDQGASSLVLAGIVINMLAAGMNLQSLIESG